MESRAKAYEPLRVVPFTIKMNSRDFATKLYELNQVHLICNKNEHSTVDDKNEQCRDRFTNRGKFTQIAIKLAHVTSTLRAYTRSPNSRMKWMRLRKKV